MNKFQKLLLFLTALPLFTDAQPVNDDCGGVIHLGAAPTCPGTALYSNLGATASDVGAGPFCFEGGNPANDVWFAFTAVSGISDYTITLTGVPDGATPAIANPQIALYRGDCTANGLAELACASAGAGAGEVALTVEGLTPNTTYYLRADSYSLDGLPTGGAFQLCVGEKNIFTIDEGGSTACSGLLYDSGGPDGDYNSNENHAFTICPDAPHDCLLFTLEYYFIEPRDMAGITDLLAFFDGPQANPALLIAQIGGFDFEADGGGGVCYQVQATSGCLTVQFISDAMVTFEGFRGRWECAGDCTPRQPVSLQSNISNQQAVDFISTPAITASITNIDCPGQAYGAFETDDPAGLGLERGLLLTTGSLAWAAGPNTDPGNGTFDSDNSAPGDPDLDYLSQLSGNDFPSENACIVELEVFTTTNELAFEYIFGSEEYQEFVGQEYNDIFAFLISGPGITGDPNIGNQQNIAVLPNGSNTPVEINSVNHLANWEYYRNNNNGIATQYDGLTSDFMGVKKSLTARADVLPCNTYHLKLAIADRNDPFYDSGVFISELRGGTPQLAVQFNSGIDYLAESCTDVPDELAIFLPAPSGDTLTYQLEIGGTATPGADYLLNAPDSVLFLPGQTSLSFPLTVLSDQEEEPTETITIRLTNDFGCGQAVYAELTVNLADRLRVTINDGRDTAYICTDGTITLQATGGEAYSWSPANVFDDPNSAGPVADPPADQWVYLEGMLGPCVAYDSVFLKRVVPFLDVSPAGPLAICRGDTVRLAAPNNVGGFSLSWSPAEGLDDPAGETPLASPEEPVTYYAAIDITGCVVRDSVSIDVAVFDFPTVTPDTTLCGLFGVQLADPIHPDSTTTRFRWAPAAGLENDTIAGPVAFPEETTTYRLIATAANGACADTAEVTVTVLPAEVRIGNPDSLEICRGTPVELTATTTSGTASGLVWAPDDGSLSDTSGLLVTALPAVSTWYFAHYRQGPCLVSDSVFVRVDSLPALAITAVPEQEAYCQGDSIRLASPPYDTAGFPNIQHEWMPTAGLITDSASRDAIIEAQESIAYRRATINGACRDTAELWIEVIAPLIGTLSIDGPTSPVCAGDSVRLLAEGLPGASGTFRWTASDGSRQDGPSALFYPEEAADYTLTYIGEGGCDTLTAGLSVEVRPGLSLNLETNPPGLTEAHQGDAITLNAIADQPPPLDFTWTLNQELLQQGANLFDYEDILIANPSVFTVIAGYPDGSCRDTASLSIEVALPVVKVPNAFTPNGDGHNDFFSYVIDGNIRQVLEFRVFNRWGQLVFEAGPLPPGTFPGWDGTFRGRPQPSEVYFYLLRLERYDGEVETRQGEVSLLR
ncbi:MAG: choice-of-anchor L domain-containing protein [Phaeodactylibacter sp.]|nr:choice-of-anchor L domain-containing protein [Phaeodactylibacter sp.]